MQDCHSHDHHCGATLAFDGATPEYRRILLIVTAINFSMFITELIGGHIVGSMALQADALDFLADSLTYAISLMVIGRPPKIRALAALGKAVSLAILGVTVFATTIYRAFVMVTPEAVPMGAIGLLAMFANIASVVLLYRWREGDANVRSVWLCSRNDAIGNVAVMLAAVMVAWLGNGWPDILVAAIMAGLFLNSAAQILRQGWQEYKTG